MDFQLDRTQKIAFARIISDLIEADFVVEEGEMEFFETIKNENHITKDMLMESKQWTFAESVRVLSLLPSSHKAHIIHLLEKMSMSDGTCVPLEAVQIMAVKQVFLNDAKLLSVAPIVQYDADAERMIMQGTHINAMDVLYIDNNDPEQTPPLVNDNNYQIISDKFAMAGFHFVYIPYIARDFARLADGYLQKVIRYMVPGVTNEEANAIAHHLRTINTKRFCRDLLYKKLGVDLTNEKPSLLMKLNESFVSGEKTVRTMRTPHSNFLLLEIGDDIIGQVDHLIDNYMQMLNSSIPAENNAPTRKFLYSGFHRNLFDLIAFVEEKQEYQLVVNLSLYKVSVSLKAKDGSHVIDKILDGRESALYAMIVIKSIDGGKGLDWYGHSGRRQQLIKEYHNLYTGNGLEDKDYKDRFHISKIKKKLSAYRDAIANIDSFLPILVKDCDHSFYRINAQQDSVTIIE